MEIKKALTFRASSIGDCLMGKYLLDNVHAQYPDARLCVVVGSRGTMIRDLFATYPYIEVVEANRWDIPGLFLLWRSWRGSDLVVTQYAGKPCGKFSLASKLMARLLARHGRFVGFRDASIWNFLFDSAVPFDPARAPAELERQALHAAGVKVAVPYPMLEPVSNPAVLTELGLVPGQYVVVHLFSGGGSKRGLSPERRRALVQMLADTLPPAIAVVLTGTPGERAEAGAAAIGTRAIVSTDFSLQDTFALLGASHSIVAVDTGMAHVAAQMRKPLAVLASCIGKHWWQEAQYGKDATFKLFWNPVHPPEAHVLVDYPECLNGIDFGEVARAIT